MEEVKKILKQWKLTVEPSEMNPVLTKEILVDLITRQQTYAFPQIVFERSKNMDLKWLSYETENQLDLEVLRYAREKDIDVFSLDRSPEPMQFTDEKFEKQSLITLEYLYGKMPEELKVYQKMKKAYQKGDEVELTKMMASSESEELNLKERNKYWAGKILLLNEENIFVAVGAGHLVGEDSFLEELSKVGFTIKKISFKDQR
jgi:uncharacterized protein YbaP (TraB family)